MKRPCVSRRESVALLACGACPDDQAVEIRRHMETCEGCREYFRQLCEVCEEQTTAASQLPQAPVSARLSSRVALSIRKSAETRQPATRLGGPGSLFCWGRIAGWVALLGLLVVGVLRIRDARKPSPVEHVTTVPRQAPAPMAEAARPSITGNSLIAYRRALNHSPEALDELLSEESARPSSNPQMALRGLPDLHEFEL